ncbi:MAG: hypothetical protein Q9217_000186, partial [Psora testacea]
MASPLHNTLISQVTKRVTLTQTVYSTASQKETESAPTPSNSRNSLAMISRHDSITIKTSRSDLSTTLPGATTPDDCTQSSPCSGDITNYDPSVGKGACGDPVYQPTDSVIAIAYGMMGTLSSGTEMNPLCGRYVQIENPANGKMARGMVVDKCMGCGSTSIDLSMELFKQLVDDVNVGRVHD